jgi:hypothetical protein
LLSLSLILKIGVLFPNAGSLPLLLFESLCEQPILNSTYAGSSLQCFNTATSMIFVYLIGWHLWFYMWGFYKLGEADDFDKQHPSIELEAQCSSSADTTSSGTATPALTLNSETAAACVESTVGIPALASEEHKSVLASLSSVYTSSQELPQQQQQQQRQQLSHCSWKSLKQRVQQWQHRRQQQRARSPPPARWVVQLRRVLTAPANVAVVLSVAVALIPPLRRGLFHSQQSPLRPFGAALTTIGQPLVALQTLLMAASLAQTQVKLQTEVAADSAGGELAFAKARHLLRKQQVFTGAVFVLTPLVVVPACGFALFVLLDTYTSVLGSNQLMRLLLLMQLGMPGAQAVLVSLAHLGLPNMTSIMSR